MEAERINAIANHLADLAGRGDLNAEVSLTSLPRQRS